jgi:hypothetical protein
MKKLVKWMAILVSVLFLGGSAWAYDVSDHVKAAPNGKGDLLFFKYYVVANGGWETKISVTNTNMAASVVAKVVVRSYKNSTELLDFLIYLSPADVWTGKLYWDGTQTKIYSEDSSCLNQNGTWASPTDPLDFALKTIGTPTMPFCADDSTSIGYIYVLQSAWSNDNGAARTPATPNFGKPGVAKADIKKYYESSSMTNHVGPFWYYADGYPWINPLAGYEVFSNATLGLFSSSVQVQAMADYKCTTYLQLTQTNRLGDPGLSMNSLGEVEAALTKNYLSLPYVESDLAATVHILGFPTKYTKIIDPTKACDASNLAFDGPFFQYSTHVANARVVLYDAKVWDVNEVYTQTQIFSPSPTAGLRDEVNLLTVSSENTDNFPEGWVSYPFYINSNTPFLTITENQEGRFLYYEGAPVLSAVVFFGAADAYAIDGAWTDGDVQNFPGYQYADSYTPFQ